MREFEEVIRRRWPFKSRIVWQHIETGNWYITTWRGKWHPDKLRTRRLPKEDEYAQR